MGNFVPELGHMMFGQPSQHFQGSRLLIAVLMELQRELDRVQENNNQEEYNSPFLNTGNRFECPTFQVHAYSWDDKVAQPWNLKWRDVEISWYKHARRDVSVNQELSLARIEEFLNECLEAIQAVERPLYEDEERLHKKKE